jgi:hypothetical protein
VAALEPDGGGEADPPAQRRLPHESVERFVATSTDGPAAHDQAIVPEARRRRPAQETGASLGPGRAVSRSRICSWQSLHMPWVKSASEWATR